MNFIHWLIGLFLSFFSLFGFGCLSLPSKDANLTEVYRPNRTGPSEIVVPAQMLGGPEGASFSYKGDSDKNISFIKREWFDNGNLKSEITAGGSRSEVLDSTTNGISGIESNRFNVRLQQLEMTIAVFERTLDKVLAIANARMSATTPVADESSKIDKLLEAFSKILPLLDKANANPN